MFMSPALSLTSSGTSFTSFDVFTPNLISKLASSKLKLSNPSSKSIEKLIANLAGVQLDLSKYKERIQTTKKNEIMA